MAYLTNIHSKLDLIAKLNPKAWDVNPPQFRVQFPFSDPHVELMVADVVKHIGANLDDRALAERTLELSQKMATNATGSIAASWEPGDDICPPWPWPWPGPYPFQNFAVGPQPEPWKVVTAAEQIELAHMLTQASGLTMSKEYNVALKSLGTAVARNAMSRLADEFEKCGTKPRPPFPPRPKFKAAAGGA